MFFYQKKLDFLLPKKHRKMISIPKKPINIPEKSQWLSGVGSGSWFTLLLEKDMFIVNRYCPEGTLECSGYFKINKKGFDIKKMYQFSYLSHCMLCTILQDNKTYILNCIES